MNGKRKDLIIPFSICYRLIINILQGKTVYTKRQVYFLMQAVLHQDQNLINVFKQYAIRIVNLF
jgi:hypothetical protein